MWARFIEAAKGAFFWILTTLGIGIVATVSFQNLGQSLIDELQERYNDLGTLTLGGYSVEWLTWLGLAGVDDALEIICAAYLAGFAISAAKVALARRSV